MALHQLNITKSLTKMKDYYDVNNAFNRCIEKMKKAQKVVSNTDVNLINDVTLFRLGIEEMCEFSSLDKNLDEWEELSKSNKIWDIFQD